MVKLISKLAEEGRVHVRQVRHDVNKDVKHQQDERRDAPRTMPSGWRPRCRSSPTATSR